MVNFLPDYGAEKGAGTHGEGLNTESRVLRANRYVSTDHFTGVKNVSVINRVRDFELTTAGSAQITDVTQKAQKELMVRNEISSLCVDEEDSVYASVEPYGLEALVRQNALEPIKALITSDSFYTKEELRKQYDSLTLIHLALLYGKPDLMKLLSETLPIVVSRLMRERHVWNSELDSAQTTAADAETALNVYDEETQAIAIYPLDNQETETANQADEDPEASLAERINLHIPDEDEIVGPAIPATSQPLPDSLANRSQERERLSGELNRARYNVMRINNELSVSNQKMIALLRMFAHVECVSPVMLLCARMLEDSHVNAVAETANYFFACVSSIQRSLRRMFNFKPDAADDAGQNLLHRAALWMRIPIMQSCLRWRPSWFLVVDNRGCLPLHYVVDGPRTMSPNDEIDSGCPISFLFAKTYAEFANKSIEPRLQDGRGRVPSVRAAVRGHWLAALKSLAFELCLPTETPSPIKYWELMENAVSLPVSHGAMESEEATFPRDVVRTCVMRMFEARQKIENASLEGIMVDEARLLETANNILNIGVSNQLSDLLVCEPVLHPVTLVTHESCKQHMGMPSVPEASDCPIAACKRANRLQTPENPSRLEVLCHLPVYDETGDVACPGGILNGDCFGAMGVEWVRDPKPAKDHQILAVHSATYFARLQSALAKVHTELANVRAEEEEENGSEGHTQHSESEMSMDEEEDDDSYSGRKTTSPYDVAVALDDDTFVTEGSHEAARLAAGAAIFAIDRVCDPSSANRRAFALVRPPGHHMGPDGSTVRGMDLGDELTTHSQGFCLFNNAAIAAAHARRRWSDYGVRRVAVVDFDVHHGNGTEACFRNTVKVESVKESYLPGDDILVRKDTQVQYMPWLDETDATELFFGSVHVFDGVFYPQTGKSGAYDYPEVVNLGTTARDTTATVRSRIMTQLFAPLARFAPDLIIISAGFDGHAADVLNNNMGRYHDADFFWMTENLVAIANEFANGRVVSILEGGYNTAARQASPFARAVSAHVRALCMTPTTSRLPVVNGVALSTLAACPPSVISDVEYQILMHDESSFAHAAAVEEWDAAAKAALQLKIQREKELQAAANNQVTATQESANQATIVKEETSMNSDDQATTAPADPAQESALTAAHDHATTGDAEPNRKRRRTSAQRASQSIDLKVEEELRKRAEAAANASPRAG